MEYGLREDSFDKVVVNNDLEEAYQELKNYIDHMYDGVGKEPPP